MIQIMLIGVLNTPLRLGGPPRERKLSTSAEFAELPSFKQTSITYIKVLLTLLSIKF
jgi:hypothetical protein